MTFDFTLPPPPQVIFFSESCFFTSFFFSISLFFLVFLVCVCMCVRVPSCLSGDKWSAGVLGDPRFSETGAFAVGSGSGGRRPLA